MGRVIFFFINYHINPWKMNPISLFVIFAFSPVEAFVFSFITLFSQRDTALKCGQKFDLDCAVIKEHNLDRADD